MDYCYRAKKNQQPQQLENEKGLGESESKSKCVNTRFSQKQFKRINQIAKDTVHIKSVF